MRATIETIGIREKLRGRRKIFTSHKVITKDNLLDVLTKAKSTHLLNVAEMNFLIDYERGNQPLLRDKIIRPEIDIEVNSNLANYIKEFKIGYVWSSPAMLVQRGNQEMHKTSSDGDDSGINALNESLINGSNMGRLEQSMAEFVEICGIGHRMVDVKSSDWEDGQLADIYTLDSRYAFNVYWNGPGQKKVLSVSYYEDDVDDKTYFTCITDDMRYEVINDEIVDMMPNPLGKCSIVEYERTFDRTGCFEREIPRMDSLNILLSDFTNDVAQRTQEVWWGDNIDFKQDEKGNRIEPQSGDWVLTYSGEGKTAKIQPLSSSFDGSSTLNAISSARNEILQDCKVPIQYDSAGGGSTGTAMDMGSGWSATELDAMKEQQMIEAGKREELDLVLRAIQKVPERILPLDDPIRSVHLTDVNFHFTRRKSLDMSIKANTFSTYFNAGVHPRHILQAIDAFPDNEQVYLDSKDMFDALQKKMVSDTSMENTDDAANTSSDPVNQIGQSPLLDGMNTDRSTVV